MIITAWRITKRRFVKDAFSGEGARRNGGRWNTLGKPLVYTSEHASLAVLELLVHLESSRDLDNYVIIACSFDEQYVERLDVEKLPRSWAVSPAMADVQRIGDRWLEEKRSLVLEVPSAVLPIERKFLINPIHPDFRKINVSDPLRHVFDPRLTSLARR